ncbi:iron dicitrate transport regulator FecR [Terrimonas sp.]|uniref:FecR family protein n=1 Tax=Terrimonas sp. TaxID=1914338 RepID=UPI000D51A0C5|nr:FecR family protein [Terrimonas sp.]PVD49925.1 iron dicitrate transport regulator FecR [Terrimonas sp.]
MEELDERLYYLMDRLFNNSCTQAEKEELAYWIEKAQDDTKLKHYLSDMWNRFEPLEDMAEEKANHLFSSVTGTNTPAVLQSKSKSRYLLFSGIAAACILVIASGAYIFFSGQSKINTTHAIADKKQSTVNDVAPGQFKAKLTLSDGSQVVLDTVRGQIITGEGAAQINTSNGHLYYNISTEKQKETVYNTLATNRGEQYSMTLSDGTKLWLNAASSVRFPVAFTGNYRDVEITGEVYFEVARNKEQPFRVKAGEEQIEVLGTHFNINAYSDEPFIRTTLIEGSVKVNLGTSSTLLKPNEQALVKNGDTKINVSPADGQAAIAWKSGYFKLTNSEVSDIMRQIARWYDIEVVYKGNVPSGTISGEVPRSLNLSEVLKVLVLSDVRCQLEGKTLIITN